MSFGFSVGDFVAAAQLITSIVSSLRSCGGASSDFQELVRELDLLQHALTDIEHLSGSPAQLSCINAIKCAALNCHYVLDEFAGKLKKYEKSLGGGMDRLQEGDAGNLAVQANTSGNSSRMAKFGASCGKSLSKIKGASPLIKAGERINDGVKKARWELFMKEDVRDLRAYLVGHVGSLNLRMVTVSLSSASLSVKQADDNRTVLEVKLEELRQGIRNEFRSQQVLLQSHKTLLDKVIDLVSGEIVPQLKEHGNSNAKVLDIVRNLQTRIPDPDIRFTWFQEPCRLEDARGHRIPIPSEFSFKLVRAIIHEVFRTGPGRKHVLAGDYQISNIRNSDHLITGWSENGLIPGMNMRMAIVLNKLHNSGQCCPMPRCGSTTLIEELGGGNTCSQCGVWFSKASQISRRKFVQEVEASDDDDERPSKRMRRSKTVLTPICEEEDEDSEDELEEIAHIKNIRVPDISMKKQGLRKWREQGAQEAAAGDNTSGSVISTISSHEARRSESRDLSVLELLRSADPVFDSTFQTQFDWTSWNIDHLRAACEKEPRPVGTAIDLSLPPNINFHTAPWHPNDPPVINTKSYDTSSDTPLWNQGFGQLDNTHKTSMRNSSTQSYTNMEHHDPRLLSAIAPAVSERAPTPIQGSRSSHIDSLTGKFGEMQNKSSGVLDQKKRRGRSAPPGGRCHSCNRAETPQWRPGPDGALTLCNACGLHYAKLMRERKLLASSKPILPSARIFSIPRELPTECKPPSP